MLWLIFWSILFAVIFYYYCVRPLNYWKKRGVKQGKPAWLFGDQVNIVLRKESLPETIIRLYQEHPNERYSGVYQLMFPSLLIRDPELIKQITVKEFEYFVDHKSFIPENGDALWSNNLFSLKGQKWREMRPVLSPCFTTSKMKQMFVLMKEVAETFVNHFKETKNNGTIEVEMNDALTRYGNDVIASIAFGIQINSLKEEDNQFYLMGKEATNLGGFWTTLKFLGYNFSPKLYEILKISLFSAEVSRFFLGIVEETIKMREEKGIVRPDLINLLLEARRGDQKQEETTNVDTGFATVEEANLGKASEFHKRNITNVDITAHALIFFMAGFDGIASMMTFMAYELAINPDIQKRLRDEVEETNEECNGKLTYESLMRMKFMDMVVSETLRKWPIGAFADRLCTKPYTIQPKDPSEKPLELQTGDNVWIPIFGIHHDPSYYPEPEKFDPERFSDENKHKIKPYTYLPFGVGPRNCIGSRFALLECKTLFYYMLLNFEIIPIKKSNIPLRLSKSLFTAKAEDGLWLGLKPIKT